jgi:hypothetical protein
MASRSERHAAVLRALDAALDAVTRAERRGLRNRQDEPAAQELERLREALAAERARVGNGGETSPAVLGELVREVAAWTPDSEIKLLAALGAVVQAARG